MSSADHGQHADARTTLGWQTRPAAEFARFDDAMSLRLSSGRWREALDQFFTSVATAKVPTWLLACTSVVAFGVGWAAGSMFSSIATSKIAKSDKAEIAIIRKEANKEEHRAPNGSGVQGAPGTASDSKALAAKIDADVGVAPAVRPRVPAAREVRMTVPPPADTSRSPPSMAVPETKPATIAGWRVRSIDGENVVLVGPSRAWTVRRGDIVPGVGRIDTIVRWGDRWIVATSSGLISTE